MKGRVETLADPAALARHVAEWMTKSALATTGDFRGEKGEDKPSVTLLIDVNGDGKFARRGESFNVQKPFNIGGTTYEISGLGAVQIVPSEAYALIVLDLGLPDLPGQEVLREIKLKSNRFGFEPEVTAKVAKKKSPAWRIYEVPISYSGRTYEEGKKIGFFDAIQAFFCIVRYWIAN